VDIDSVADELYSLPPEKFTATRNAREREAKALGDKELAASIHLLGRPSTAAWLANQLVRQHRDEVQPFLDLGAGLRDATAMFDGDQLRELGRQQHQLVHALMQQVRELATTAGHKVSQSTARGLEDTLHAALADEEAAEHLRAGRLTGTLQRTGFPPTEGTRRGEQLPKSSSPSTSKAESAEQKHAAEVAQAERDERLARAAARDAAVGQAHARAVVDRAEAAYRQAAALVDRLRADLDKAEIERARREQEHRTTHTDLDRANEAEGEAARRLDDAVQHRKSIAESDTTNA
jgi:hypothetical protein